MHSAGGGCSGRETTSSRPDGPLSRGLEVHPAGAGDDLELWIDPRYVDAGYGWSFPARDELRIGVGSFDPHDPVKQPTLRLVEDVDATPDGYQGNWIPHRIRPATEDGVFFAGDSAGHCLPLTAEGIRTAFYFGIALGRELRAVLEGRQDRAAALKRYGAFSASHRWKYESIYAGPAVDPAPARAPAGRAHADLHAPQVSDWAFRHYLEIAPPQFAVPAPPAALRAPALRALDARRDHPAATSSRPALIACASRSMCSCSQISGGETATPPSSGRTSTPALRAPAASRATAPASAPGADATAARKPRPPRTSPAAGVAGQRRQRVVQRAARGPGRGGSCPRARRCRSWPARPRRPTDGRRRSAPWRNIGPPGASKYGAATLGHDDAAERQVAAT